MECVQPQLKHAIGPVSMVAQGIKKVGRLMSTPICEHTSGESLFKYLKPTELFDKGENFHLKVDSYYAFNVKPPHLG